MRLFLIGAMVVFGAAQLPAQNTKSVAIRNATIYDGTGKPGVVGDVLIEGERITSVAKELKAAKYDVEIDGVNLVVCPGFIDLHTHCDNGLLEFPQNCPMQRIERLYAISERLRRQAPGTLSAQQLSEEFGVTRRTIA